MAKLLENEKFRVKFYKYLNGGNFKKLNTLLNVEGNFDNEYLDAYFLKNYLNSNSYNGEIFKRVLDVPSIYINAKFNEDYIFKSLYKRDREVFFYAFKRGKIKITELLLQKIFEDDRKFFLQMVEIDDSLGNGILNDLINKNDAFALEVIGRVKSIEKSHLENAMKIGVRPEILEHLLKRDSHNNDFDNHQSGLLKKAMRNLTISIVKGGGNIDEDIKKLKLICDYAKIRNEEYQEFFNDLGRMHYIPQYSTLFSVLKTNGICDNLIDVYLNGKIKETEWKFDIFSLASDKYKPSKKTVKEIIERGDFSKAILIKKRLNVNLNEYKKELHEGLKGLIGRLEILGDERIYRLAEDLYKFAKETSFLDLEGEDLLAQLSSVEKRRDDWKRGMKMFKFCLYNITDNYGRFSGKVVSDALIMGERWSHLLNKNIDLNKGGMQEVAWAIVENNGKYGFDKKLLKKIFNLKGFSLNVEQADFLLFEGAINIFDEDKKNNLLEQKKYFKFLIDNEKINKIKGINWAYLLKQKGVKQDDEIYQKILGLARESNCENLEEE